MLGQATAHGNWSVDVPGLGRISQGRSRDRLAVNSLWNHAACRHRVSGRERLPELLYRTPSLLWHRGATLVGAMFVSIYQEPVVSVRQLAVRDVDDLPLFMANILPLYEQRLTDMGMRWLALHRSPGWLRDVLPGAGFDLHDTVVHYALEGLHGLESVGQAGCSCRRALLGDTEVILEVDKAAFEPFWQINRAIVREGLRQAAYALVAEIDDQVVGYLLAERWPADVYVSRIGVLPGCQGRGVGRGLMLAAIQRIRNDGVDRIVLNTQQSNLRSTSLYTSLGFVATGDKVAYWSKRLGCR